MVFLFQYEGLYYRMILRGFYTRKMQTFLGLSADGKGQQSKTHWNKIHKMNSTFHKLK